MKSTCHTDNGGDQYWYADAGEELVLHREDGPAVVESDGYEEWRMNGVLHRIGGPAMTGVNGEQRWIQHGVYHREDGPAIIKATGEKQWFIRGIQVDPIVHFIRRGGEIPVDNSLIPRIIHVLKQRIGKAK